MTTIAYKDGVIAYDSRVCDGSRITYDDYDKCQEVKGVKFVMAGFLCDYPRLINAWFGATFSVPIEASALVFDGESLCYAAYSEKDGLCKTPIRLERPYALGTGSDFALTAMDMGATASQAVEMAKQRDTHTGGEVRALIVLAADAPSASSG